MRHDRQRIIFALSSPIPTRRSPSGRTGALTHVRCVGQLLVLSGLDKRRSVLVRDVVLLGERKSRECDATHVRLSRRIAREYLRI